MSSKAWLRFWIDQSDHSLNICDTANTKNIKRISNQKKIDLFLDAYHLNSDQVKQPAEGPDKFELFKKRTWHDFIPFWKRKREG